MMATTHDLLAACESNINQIRSQGGMPEYWQPPLISRGHSILTTTTMMCTFWWHARALATTMDLLAACQSTGNHLRSYGGMPEYWQPPQIIWQHARVLATASDRMAACQSTGNHLGSYGSMPEYWQLPRIVLWHARVLASAINNTYIVIIVSFSFSNKVW